MKKIQGLLVGFLILSLVGCTSIATRTYQAEPRDVVLAAREGLISVGFSENAPQEAESGTIDGGRAILFWLFIGDGGSSVSIAIVEEGDFAKVEIESKKQFTGFFAQTHHDERIASYIDEYMKQNQEIWRVVRAIEEEERK